jgi:hypothetical protein
MQDFLCPSAIEIRVFVGFDEPTNTFHLKLYYMSFLGYLLNFCRSGHLDLIDLNQSNELADFQWQDQSMLTK